MMELPPELQHIGLGARTFKKKSGPANKDRSVWTDTPADTERKARVGLLLLGPHTSSHLGREYQQLSDRSLLQKFRHNVCMLYERDYR